LSSVSSSERTICSDTDATDRTWPVAAAKRWQTSVEFSSMLERNALARHLHQAEVGRCGPTWMRARSFFSASFRRRSTDRFVAILVHVDEVDDDQPGEVAQAKLPGDLPSEASRLVLRRGVLDVGARAFGAAPEFTSIETSASVWLRTI